MLKKALASAALAFWGCAADQGPQTATASLALSSKPAGCRIVAGTDCAVRAAKLDAYNGPLSSTLVSNCQAGVAMPVGGTLQSATPQTGWNTTSTVTKLVFKGKSTTMDIYAANWVAQPLGKFYAFDLAGKCKYLFSSQLSGMFEGTFTPLTCCQ